MRKGEIDVAREMGKGSENEERWICLRDSDVAKDCAKWKLMREDAPEGVSWRDEWIRESRKSG